MATRNHLEPCQQLSAYRKHVADRNFLFFRYLYFMMMWNTFLMEKSVA